MSTSKVAVEGDRCLCVVVLTNISVSLFQGGAIYFQDTSGATLTSCAFTNNSAVSRRKVFDVEVSSLRKLTIIHLFFLRSSSVSVVAVSRCVACVVVIIVCDNQGVSTSKVAVEGDRCL